MNPLSCILWPIGALAGGFAAIVLGFMLWSANATIAGYKTQAEGLQGHVVTLARANGELEVEVKDQNLHIDMLQADGDARVERSRAALQRALASRETVEARVTALLNSPVHVNVGEACIAADARLLEID